MDGFEQNLHIADGTFDGMRHDTDRVLQKLLKNMVEKESLEGSVTIKIDVSFKQEYILNTDPEVEGETRKVLSPSFSHKVGSMMQIKDEAKGGINYEGMEMVWDDELKEFIVKPIANTTQRTMFDADFQCVNDPEENVEDEEQPALEGKRVKALPGPIAEEDYDTEAVENDLPEEETNGEDGNGEAEDMSGAFGGTNLPFDSDGNDGDWGYEEPGEEY